MVESVTAVATAPKTLINLSHQAILSADLPQNLAKTKKMATPDQVKLDNLERTVRNHHNRRPILSQSEETAVSQIGTKIVLVITSESICRLLPIRKSMTKALETQSS